MRLTLVVLTLLLCACGAGSASLGGPADREHPPSAEDVATRLERARKPLPPPPTCKDAAPPRTSKSGPTLVLQDGHTQMINAISLSRDGRTLVSSGWDGIARIWDTRQNLLLQRIRVAGGSFGLSLSDDGSTLAVYANEGKGNMSPLVVKVFDLKNETAPVSITHGNFLFGLTPDGKRLAVATAGLQLYDTKTGQSLGNATFGTAQGMTMNHEGTRAAVSSFDELVLVDIPSMRIARRFKNPKHAGNQDIVDELALHGDTLWIHSMVGEVHRIDAKTGKHLGSLPGRHTHMTRGQGLLWTIESTTGKVAAFDLESGAPRGGRGSPVPAARKIAASSDGSTIVLAASDQLKGNDLRVRDAASGAALGTFHGINTTISTLTISPDGKRIATGSQLGAVTRWNAGRGVLDGVSSLEHGATGALSYDGSGTMLAAATGTPSARIYDAASGAILRQWTANPGATKFAAFLPNSDQLITAGSDGAVRRWNLAGAKPPVEAKPPFPGQVRHPPPASTIVSEVGFIITHGYLSQSGKTLAVIGSPGRRQAQVPYYLPVVSTTTTLEVALVDVTKNKTLFHTSLTQLWNNIAWVAVSPDDKTVVVAHDQKLGAHGLTSKLRVLDASTGAERETRTLPYNAPLAFLDDKLIFGGKLPSIESWPSGSNKQAIQVPDVEVTAIAPDPTRKRFLLGGSSGATSLVDVGGKLRVILMNTPNGEFVTTTPDGAFVSSLDGRRSIGWTFSHPLEGFSFAQFSDRYERPDIIEARLAGKPGQSLDPLTRPPRIEITSAPKEADGKVTVSAKVSSDRRVERVRGYANARPVVDELVCAAEDQVELELPLETGNNRVTMVAYDADGHSSTPTSHDVTSTAKGARPELWAVTIGVSSYPNLAPEQQLEYADDDARAIAGALAPFAGPSGQFAKFHATTLLDAQVTPDSVERALAGLAAMKPQDVGVVFLAGHGLRLKDGNMVLLTGKANLTSEGARAGGVGWDRIEATLRAARGRVVLLLDACHSGHVTTELVAPNEALATRLAMDNRAGVLIFAASRGSQFSYEVGPTSQGASRGLELAWDGTPPRIAQAPTTGHGLFTSAVLEALSGKAVDRDKSGGIELGEFIDYVTERVREASNDKQTPWVVRRELFGDFLIAPAR